MFCKRFPALISIFVLLIFSLTCTSASEQEIDYAEQRSLMLEKQLKARDIEDAQVLQAMQKVKRHLFVPEDRRHMAYQDRPLSIGYGQTISQPYIVALMTQLAQVEKEHKVLEIGTGSGYQAAVLAELGKKVYSVEIIPELASRARNRLQELGYSNVQVRTGDGFQGWKEHAPFDRIIVTCAPPQIPQPLLQQLAPGGRLLIPVGENRQKLKLLKMSKQGKIEKKDVLAVRFVPMTGSKVD